MLLPRKRRTSRRNTSKRRQKLSNFSTPYQPLEQRNLLATFVVNTTADVVDAEDDLLSLREAVTAANTNAVFSDAPAGDVDGDRIVFAKEAEFSRYVVTNGELSITDDLIIRGNGAESGSIHGGSRNRLFAVSTTERVQFRNLLMVGGSAEGDGGILNIGPSSDVVIHDAVLGDGVSSGSGGVISAIESRLFLRGVEFQNGNAVANGGAIYAVDSNVIVVDSSFEGNLSGGDGGAIGATGGSLGLYDSVFAGESRNEARGLGGAIRIAQSFAGDEAILVSSGSTFSGNVSNFGGAIFAGTNTSTFILDSQFSANGIEEQNATGGTTGGAILSQGNGLYITNTVFTGNRSSAGGAIASAATYSNFREIEVSENIASFAGGISLAGAEAYISDSIISGNEAGQNGGGVIVGAESTVVLRRTMVSDNSAELEGGGIWSGVGSTLRVFGSTLSENMAVEEGGAISAVDTDLLVTGATVAGNEVTGGLAYGGGIAVSGGSTLVFSSTISENVSNSGAGGFAVRNGYARLQDTDVVSNTAMNSGGGLDARSSTLVLIGGEVSFNQATEAPPFGSRAGAVNMDRDARVFVRGGTRFESNSAEAFGGAIQVPGFLSVQDAVFVSNSAASGGAIFVFDDGSAYFERTRFVNNSAEEHGAAIFARGFGFLFDTTLILKESPFIENQVTVNENGFPVVVDEGTFVRETLSSFSGNTPNNGIGTLG